MMVTSSEARIAQRKTAEITGTRMRRGGSVSGPDGCEVGSIVGVEEDGTASSCMLSWDIMVDSDMEDDGVVSPWRVFDGEGKAE